jgi:hypothetical protein
LNNVPESHCAGNVQGQDQQEQKGDLKQQLQIREDDQSDVDVEELVHFDEAAAVVAAKDVAVVAAVLEEAFAVEKAVVAVVKGVLE